MSYLHNNHMKFTHTACTVMNGCTPLSGSLMTYTHYNKIVRCLGSFACKFFGHIFTYVHVCITNVHVYVCAGSPQQSYRAAQGSMQIHKLTGALLTEMCKCAYMYYDILPKQNHTQPLDRYNCTLICCTL